jgi:two-component system OmpR family response regulator
MRVLLIEDDKMVGAAVEQALRDAAYAVDWVTDGETAIHAAENEAYEVALLDLGLPLADGREVLRRLRALGRKLPVIIVTARDGVDDRIDGLDLGADDYLVKPFEIRELLARMRAVLRREGSGSPALLSNGRLHLDPATREASFHGEASLLPLASSRCFRRCWHGRARSCRAASWNGKSTAGTRKSRAMRSNS